MELARRRALWILAAVGAVVVAALAWQLFAPERSTTVDEAAPESAATLATGSFRDGDPLHHVSGTIALLQDAEGYVLRFEDYEATAGPDVYFYLTREGGASSAETVEREGVRVPTDTPKGQATLRGSFNVRVPEGIDPTAYGGLSVWCDSYNVLFGWAGLA